jgi:predicted nucleic acid-binding protein
MERLAQCGARKPYTLDLSIKEVANALWRRVAFIGM